MIGKIFEACCILAGISQHDTLQSMEYIKVLALADWAASIPPLLGVVIGGLLAYLIQSAQYKRDRRGLEQFAFMQQLNIRHYYLIWRIVRLTRRFQTKNLNY